MARRGGFRTQAPRETTLIIAVIFLLLGLLDGLNVIHLPNSLGFWSLVISSTLLVLGSLLDGL